MTGVAALDPPALDSPELDPPALCCEVPLLVQALRLMAVAATIVSAQRPDFMHPPACALCDQLSAGRLVHYRVTRSGLSRARAPVSGRSAGARVSTSHAPAGRVLLRRHRPRRHVLPASSFPHRAQPTDSPAPGPPGSGIEQWPTVHRGREGSATALRSPGGRRARVGASHTLQVDRGVVQGDASCTKRPTSPASWDPLVDRRLGRSCRAPAALDLVEAGGPSGKSPLVERRRVVTVSMASPQPR